MFFTVLGVKPTIGRLLAPIDDNLQSGHVVVISYGLWQRQVAGAPDLVGRSINLDGQSYLVVAVGRRFPISFERVGRSRIHAT
jgi:putative ABC transport system permease protein